MTQPLTVQELHQKLRELVAQHPVKPGRIQQIKELVALLPDDLGETPEGNGNGHEKEATE